jgi:hypothetical protein
LGAGVEVVVVARETGMADEDAARARKGTRTRGAGRVRIAGRWSGRAEETRGRVKGEKEGQREGEVDRAGAG